MGAVFGSLDRDDDVLALGLNRAVDLLAKKLASVRTIGPHPGDKDLVSVRKGRFGPYVQHGKTVANLPRGMAMEEISLDQAVALLNEKGKALKPRGAAGRKGGRAPAKAAKSGNDKSANDKSASDKSANDRLAKAPARTAPAPKNAAANKASDKKTAAKKTAAKSASKVSRKAAE
jgi:DNA topoisomerase-1